MKIGICTALERLSEFAAMGVDYIEVAVASLMAMDAGAFEAAAKAADAARAAGTAGEDGAGVGVEACNVFFPGASIKLVGPERDEGAIRAYLAEALRRVARVGAKVVVLGSGAARRIPEGYDAARARAEFAAAAAMAGDEAQKAGVTVALEPLNRKETNLLNSVAEGAALCREIGHPCVRLLADFYHMRAEGEPMGAVAEAGGLLVHAHIARGEGRTYPLDATEDEYGAFFAALAQAGYRGRVSVEGSTQDAAADGPRSAALLRSLAAQHGL